MSQAVVPFRHPLLRVVDDLAALLDSVAEAQPVFLGTRDKETLLVGLRRQINRLEALEARTLASAGRRNDSQRDWTNDGLSSQRPTPQATCRPSHRASGGTARCAVVENRNERGPRHRPPGEPGGRCRTDRRGCGGG